MILRGKRLLAKAAFAFVLSASQPFSVHAQTCPGGGAFPSSIHFSSQKTLSRSGKPDRKYRIQTPTGYDPTQPSKVVLIFHGWGGNGRAYSKAAWAANAAAHDYIIVAPDGLGEGSYNSWSFPGSTDGVGQDGTSITTCDNTQAGPDYCDGYASCVEAGSCAQSRCGWTQCLDDDFDFVRDLIADVGNYICQDSARVYAVGISNGGMFAWALAQSDVTAPLLAGIAPIIGLPMHDYNLPPPSGIQVPVLGIYGSSDPTVPPGTPTSSCGAGDDPSCSETTDGEGYYYVKARYIHHTFAEAYGCDVTPNQADDPGYAYDVPGRSEITCETHCDPQVGGPPMSVDCRADMGHSSPAWTLDAALKFFDAHYEAAGGDTTAVPTKSPTPGESTAAPTSSPSASPSASPQAESLPPTPTPSCSDYDASKPCRDAGCSWSGGRNKVCSD